MAELSSVDYAFLAILKVEDREISNSELDEIYGFRLVGRPLQRLLDARYIATEKKPAPYRHSITRAGEKALAESWGLDDDHVAKGEGRSAREKQLWAGIVALQNLLAARPGARPVSDAAVPVTEPPGLDGRIRSAYGKLAATPGAWVDLTALRGQLADVPKGELDQALKAMLRDDDVRLEPEPFGHRVGEAERQAAVHIGGEDRHKLAIGSR
ncbi:hypothetical protein [Actinoplanes sp. NPDC051411]|uniref:hypothetical protein n=1 Tax=Actinoplanes sp. NPDC051411 TaxID=3155522 RepID=UPI003445A5B5